MERTIRIKLNTSSSQAKTLLRVLEDYTTAFNSVCEYGWVNQERNGVKLHHATYYDLKAKLVDLPSQLLYSARTKASETLKSVFARFAAKCRAKQPRSSFCPARYDARSYWVKWNTEEVSLATHSGRLVLSFDVPPFAQKYLVHNAHTASADLIYCKGQFWLNVVVTLPDPDYADKGQVVGVDLGLVRPAVTAHREFLGKRHWQEIDR